MNAKDFFRQTNLVYYALLAGQVLFCGVILFVILDPETRQSGWPEAPFGVLVPALTASVAPIALLLTRQQLSKGPEQQDLFSKVAHYRSLVILRSAVIEGANLFCLVVFLLENNSTFLIYFAAGLLIFLYFRPSTNEFLRHYQLSGAEKSEFHH